MSINQIISTITDPPDTNDPLNFDARADQLFNIELPQLVTELNVYREEANLTAADVNLDKLTAQEQVVLATEQANIATQASLVAAGAANYRGEYSATVTYQVGQSVSYLGDRFIAKTVNLGVTPVDGANWFLIDLETFTHEITSGNTQVVNFNNNYQTLNADGIVNNGRINVSFVSSKSVDDITLILDSSAEIVPFLIGGSIFDNIVLSVSGQNTAPQDIAFSADGTKLFMVGSTATASIFQYSLPTPFELTGATYDGVSFSVAGQDTAPQGIAFNTNGTKFFMLGDTNDRVYQYSLPTPFILTGATYDGVSFLVSAQDTAVRSIAFNADGTKFFILGDTLDIIFQYSLPTPFILTGATYDNISLSVNPRGAAPRGITFSTDGKKLYLLEDTNNFLFQYSLPTPFILTGATYDFVSFSVNQDASPRGIRFNPSGTKFFVVGEAVDRVNQYSVGTEPVFIFPATLKTNGLAPVYRKKNIYKIATVDNGVSYQVISKNEDVDL